VTSGRYVKADAVAAIAAWIGVAAPPMSTGSKEPREIFAAVNRVLSLGIDPGETKTGLARGIVEASGAVWLPHFESRGETVTLPGLRAVLTAVEFFLQ
jgi:hypothetical protein